MGRLFSKNSLLLGILLCSAIVNLAQARAQDTEEEDDTWGFGWGSDEDGKEEPKVKESESNNDHSHHDDHSNHQGHHHEAHQPVLAAASPVGIPKQSEGGLQSGNFAAHNESCGPLGKNCIEKQNLVCSANDNTGRCICNSGFVYVRQTETCWNIPKSEEDSCQHDVQCHAGLWGALSRCNKHTARCECFDYATGGKRETVLVEKVCYIKKTIGDLCNDHLECNKTIHGYAYCKPGDHQSSGGASYLGSCQCRENSLFWKPFNACLPLLGNLKDECKISEQCINGTLGQLSRCSQNSTCECHSPNYETVFYGELSKCFRRREFNDTCRDVDECKASLGPDVQCGVVEVPEEPENEMEVDAARNRTVCYCPAGKTCRPPPNGAFSTLYSSSFAALAVAAVVGVFL